MTPIIQEPGFTIYQLPGNTGYALAYAEHVEEYPTLAEAHEAAPRENNHA